MENRNYVKTYKPLIAWLIILPLVVIGVSESLETVNENLKLDVLISFIIIVVGLYVLMLIVYKREYVYWISGGPSYEEARAAGSKKRRQYAKKHLNIFTKMMLLSFIYIGASLVLKIPLGMDLLIIPMIIIISVFFTMKIRFEH